MTPDVARHLAAAGGMADQHRIVQIELLDDRSEIVGVGVHVVAVPGLARAAMAAPVVRDRAVTMGRDEHQLVVPRVGVQRPTMTEDDRLAGSPVLVEQFGAVSRRDHVRAHRLA